jgi:hypothetical protein
MTCVPKRQPLLSVYMVLILDDTQGQGTSLSEQTKEVATSIEHNLELGARFDHLVHTCEEADAVLDVYSKEHYLLAKNGDKLIVCFLFLCNSIPSPVHFTHWADQNIDNKSSKTQDTEREREINLLYTCRYYCGFPHSMLKQLNWNCLQVGVDTFTLYQE